MATDDCAGFETLLDRLLCELRLELSQKYRLDVECLKERTEEALKGADCEAPTRALPNVRIEEVHSMLTPVDLNNTSLPISGQSGSNDPQESNGNRSSVPTIARTSTAQIVGQQSNVLSSTKKNVTFASARESTLNTKGSVFASLSSGEKHRASARRNSRSSNVRRNSSHEVKHDISVTSRSPGRKRTLLHRVSDAFQPSRPDATSRVVWDVIMCAVMMLLILIEATSFAIPECQEGLFAFAWSQFLLVVFTLDVLVNFNTSLVWIVGRKVVVIEDRWQIAKAYCRGWFIIDTLSTFPFDMVLGSVISASNSRMFKLGKILRMARMVKGFMKIAKLMQHWAEIQDRMQEKALELIGCQGHSFDKVAKYISRAWCLFFFLLLETHMVVCGLLVFTRYVPSTSWRTSGVDIHDLDPLNRYVTAFRDVVHVLTTGTVNEGSGFGDILPTMLVVWFYVQLHVVIAVVVGVKGDPGLSDSDYTTKCSRLRRYLRHHNVIKRVRDEVDTHLSKAGKYAGFNLDSLLEELPSTIRQSVSAGLYYPFYVHMAFFTQDGTSEAFEYEICALIESIFYRPHDKIVSKGSALHGLHYLSEGYAAITRPKKGEDDEEIDWTPKNYLFLEGLFAPKSLPTSTADVEAIEACEVWFLARTAFDKLLQETDQDFRSRLEVVRSKIHFSEELSSWLVEVSNEDDGIQYRFLDYLVEDGRFSYPTSDFDDFSMSQTLSMFAESSSFVSRHSLPAGKRFHYFLSHRKRHSKLGNRPEFIAQSIHDALDVKGFTGFFDVDNLVEISQPALEQAVRDSCAMIVVLNDETADSEWCRLEWECAADSGIPVKCVVDAQHCNKADILDAIGRVNSSLLQYQWSEYLDRYRKSVTQDLADWLKEVAQVPIADIQETEIGHVAAALTKSGTKELPRTLSRNLSRSLSGSLSGKSGSLSRKTPPKQVLVSKRSVEDLEVAAIQQQDKPAASLWLASI